MKKHHLLFFSILLFGFLNNQQVIGQITFGDNPDKVCAISKLTTYQFDATAIPNDPVYSLLVARPGMTISASTGLITWTPANLSDGGKVVVQVTNTGFSRTDTILFYVSEGIQCLPGAVAYWKLDEPEAGTGQTTYYDSKNSHNGTEVGSLQDSIGKVGRARKFPGTIGNGITVSDHADFRIQDGGSFTVSLWLKPTTTDYSGGDDNVVLFGKDEGYPGKHWWIGFDKGSSDLTFGVRDASDNFIDAHIKGYELTVYSWHHLVCQYDANSDQLKMFMDNSQTFDGILNRAFVATDDFDANDALSIGFLEQSAGWDFPFNGTMDEVLFFKKAISTNAIDSLYNAGIAGNPACPDGNSAPLFTSVPLTTAKEDSSYSYTAVAKDIDPGTTLVYSVPAGSLPSWLSFNATTHVLSGNPVNADVGVYPITIQVTDGEIPTPVLQNFNLTVVNVNDAPQITTSPVLVVNEEQAYSYDVNATDVDAGDVLTYSLTAKPAWLSINSSTGVITGTAPANDTGSYSVTVRVTDVALDFAEQSYTLDIRNVNDPPVITGQNPLQVDEDNSLLIQLSDILYTDVDNPANDITLTVLSGTNYTFAGNTVTPALDYHGTLTVNIQVSDLLANTAGTAAVTVNPVNDAPVIASLPDAIAIEGQSYAYVFNATDADGDALTYSVPMLPSWLTYLSASRIISGTPAFNDIGTDTIKLSVTDGTAITDAKIAVTVITDNQIPVITSTPITAVNEDQQYIYSIVFSDADAGDVVTLSAVTLPDWLNLNVAQAVLTGTPTNDQVGMNATAAFQVKLKVSDGKQDSTQTFTITVTNINDTPVINGQKDTLGTKAGGSVAISLDNIDVEDVDNLIGSLTLTVLPGTDYSIAGNTVTINEGVGEGLVPVNIRVSDPAGANDESVYKINVLLTGLHDLVNSSSLINNIYPVPAGDHVVFEFAPSGIISLQIIDITGKVVIEEQLIRNETTYQVNTSRLNSGIYMYKAQSGKYFQVGKFAVSKN